MRQLMELARVSALAEMANGIAHEINQPLGAIATFAQAGERLINRPEPQVGRALDVFRQINQESMTAAEGIRRVAGLFAQTAPDRISCQLALIVEDMRPVWETLTKQANVEYAIEVDGSIPEVAIDKLQVQYVIFALFQHALEACRNSKRPGRVTVDVRADRYAVEVGVTDTGDGIDEDLRDRIFKPFQSPMGSGDGLALAACRYHVEAHEGTIGFENDKDVGCRFWFRLPVTPAS